MSFLMGIMRQQTEYARLEALEEELKSARKLEVKHCVKCGFCCHARACIPTPTELKKIAKFLKLTPKELIERYFVIDKINPDDPYYVKAAGENIKDLVGKFIPNERTFDEGKCVFLGKNNLCKIYPIRPKSAKDAKCWDGNSKREENSIKQIIKAWKGNQLLKQFKIDGDRLETEANY